MLWMLSNPCQNRLLNLPPRSIVQANLFCLGAIRDKTSHDILLYHFRKKPEATFNVLFFWRANIRQSLSHM